MITFTTINDIFQIAETIMIKKCIDAMKFRRTKIKNEFKWKTFC